MSDKPMSLFSHVGAEFLGRLDEWTIRTIDGRMVRDAKWVPIGLPPDPGMLVRLAGPDGPAYSVRYADGGRIQLVRAARDDDY